MTHQDTARETTRQFLLAGYNRRRELKLSIPQVAELSGLSESAVTTLEYRIRHGNHNIPAHNLLAYLAGVGLTLTLTPLDGYQPPQRRGSVRGGADRLKQAEERRATALRLAAENVSAEDAAEVLGVTKTYAARLLREAARSRSR